MKVTVGIRCYRLVPVGQKEFTYRLTVRVKHYKLPAALCLKENPCDAVFLGHGMKYTSHLYRDFTAGFLYHGNVFLPCPSEVVLSRMLNPSHLHPASLSFFPDTRYKISSPFFKNTCSIFSPFLIKLFSYEKFIYAKYTFYKRGFSAFARSTSNLLSTSFCMPSTISA